MLINDQHNFFDLYKCAASTSAVISIYIYSIYNVAEGQPELIFYVIRFAQLVLPSILGYFFALEIHDHDRSYSKCYAEFYIPSVFKVGQQQVSNFKLKFINY